MSTWQQYKKLLRDLEANGVKNAYIFLSRDRAQQWVDIITSRHTERLPESSAAVIDTDNPKTVRYYGKKLEQEIEQRARVRREILDSMYNTLGLAKRNL